MHFLNFLSEPLIESIPSVHILLCLYFQEPSNSQLIGDNLKLFWIAFGSSVFTAAFGIAKVLKVGSCRLVPNEGLLGGYAQLGFILLFINILFTFMTKGLLLGFTGFLFVFSSTSKSAYSLLQIVGIWIGLNVLPQFLYVSIITRINLLCLLTIKLMIYSLFFKSRQLLL